MLKPSGASREVEERPMRSARSLQELRAILGNVERVQRGPPPLSPQGPLGRNRTASQQAHP
eukprot:7740635-Prorocentrum_lima.AAC.1